MINFKKDNNFNFDKSKVAFEEGGISFEAYFGDGKMYQRNVKTKYERRIRMCLKCDESVGKTLKDKNKATSKFYYWEWLNDSNEYTSFSPYASILLEKNYQIKIKSSTDDILNTNKANTSVFDFKIFTDNISSTQIEQSLVEYTIDLDKMEQINKKSGFSRKIKRELSGIYII